MFLQVLPDSPEEVFHVTMNMPLGWNQHLTPATIHNTTTLQLRAREYQDALINASVSTAANLVTADNIISVLQKAGYTRTGGNSGYSKNSNASGSSYRHYTPRTAHVTAHATEGLEEPETEEESIPNDPVITQQVFAVMKRKEAPPSRRGPFPFDKQDQVHTSIGRLPAWPCRACGSTNHWDRECPMWDRFQNQVKSAKWVEKEDPAEEGQLYTQVYLSYLEQIDVSSYVLCEEQIDVDARLVEKMALASSTTSIPVAESSLTIIRKSSVEDVEDEEQKSQQLKLKAQGPSLLEDVEDVGKPCNPLSEDNNLPRYYAYSAETETATEEQSPPATGNESVKVPRRKKAAPGRAAVGTSVLSVRGRVNRVEEREIDLRLDSGADVSLISQDFLETLKVKPAIRQGMKMRLWQLTSQNEALAGYVNVPLFVEAEDGTILETEIEAYIVPGMSVDILLGEDYQQSHEIAVRRSIETGTRIKFGRLATQHESRPSLEDKGF